MSLAHFRLSKTSSITCLAIASNSVWNLQTDRFLRTNVVARDLPGDKMSQFTNKSPESKKRSPQQYFLVSVQLHSGVVKLNI